VRTGTRAKGKKGGANHRNVVKTRLSNGNVHSAKWPSFSCLAPAVDFRRSNLEFTGHDRRRFKRRTTRFKDVPIGRRPFAVARSTSTSGRRSENGLEIFFFWRNEHSRGFFRAAAGLQNDGRFFGRVLELGQTWPRFSRSFLTHFLQFDRATLPITNILCLKNCKERARPSGRYRVIPPFTLF